MASFTTRVELHNASSEDYDTLHDEMRKRDFSRVITGDTGVTYHLPFAEYACSGTMTRAVVLQRAKAAAAVTGCSAAVLVTESAGRSWDGLKKV